MLLKVLSCSSITWELVRNKNSLGPTQDLLNQKLAVRPPNRFKSPAELLLGIKSIETNIGLKVESSLNSSLLSGILH